MPVTIWQPSGVSGSELPRVLVAHGFGGSRQMMAPVSMALARAGHLVVAFDFRGHGRNPAPLSPDVHALDGTTAQLVTDTIAVARAVNDRFGPGPTALVGHSMATDILLRAGPDIDEVAAYALISMYSETVTADFPERLLIVSGEWEHRLRDVALDALRQMDPNGTEATTVTSETGATRRAVFTPGTEHAGVLYAPATQAEVTRWVSAATGADGPVITDRSGWLLVGLLGSLMAVFFAITREVASTSYAVASLPRAAVFWAVLAPAVAAFPAALMPMPDLLGLSGFTRLALFFALWAAVQWAVLWRAGWRPDHVDLPGSLLLMVWAVGLFDVALDRFGAAFLPLGPRGGVLLLLAIGTIAMMVSDAALAARLAWPARILARLWLVVALATAMFMAPGALGLSFTALPVMGLFFLVYGSAARWISARRGPGATGVALGVILAWSLAASTPLFFAS